MLIQIVFSFIWSSRLFLMVIDFKSQFVRFDRYFIYSYELFFSWKINMLKIICKFGSFMQIWLIRFNNNRQSWFFLKITGKFVSLIYVQWALFYNLIVLLLKSKNQSNKLRFDLVRLASLMKTEWIRICKNQLVWFGWDLSPKSNQIKPRTPLVMVT